MTGCSFIVLCGHLQNVLVQELPSKLEEFLGWTVTNGQLHTKCASVVTDRTEGQDAKTRKECRTSRTLAKCSLNQKQLHIMCKFLHVKSYLLLMMYNYNMIFYHINPGVE